MKKLITENDVKKIVKEGRNVIVISKDTVVTPLAKDMIRTNRMTIIEKESSANNPFLVIRTQPQEAEGYRLEAIIPVLR